MGPRAQASNALGWVSIACWILVYSPQIIENYQLQSGEGLSVLFVVIWLFGDVTNLVGASIAGLLPTVIIIAVYYTLCDVILLIQIYWYRHLRRSHPHTDAERTSLLSPTPPNKDVGQRRDSTTWAALMLEYVGGLCFIATFGLAAWWLSSRGEDRTPGDGKPDSGSEIVVDLTSQILGWLSALSYLGSRIPQILKNRQTKCEGLSLALFMFTILGNITYVLSICVLSIQRSHLIANAPWLAGSSLTILLDVVVLGQFFYYRSEETQLRALQPEPIVD